MRDDPSNVCGPSLCFFRVILFAGGLRRVCKSSHKIPTLLAGSVFLPRNGKGNKIIVCHNSKLFIILPTTTRCRNSPICRDFSALVATPNDQKVSASRRKPGNSVIHHFAATFEGTIIFAKRNRNRNGHVTVALCYHDSCFFLFSPMASLPLVSNPHHHNLV